MGKEEKWDVDLPLLKTLEVDVANSGTRSIYYSEISSEAESKLSSFKAELYDVSLVCWSIQAIAFLLPWRRMM